MKKPVLYLVSLLVVLAGCALALGLLFGRQKLTLTFVEYKRWPHGATLRLTNGTRATIRYLTERDGTPAGNPFLRMKKGPSGWRTTPVTLHGATVRNMVTGKVEDIVFFVIDPAAPPGDRQWWPLGRDLEPGRTTEFWVRLERGASPERVGLVCIVPQGKLARIFQPWRARLRQWLRLGARVPGEVRLWCPEPLHAS